MKATPLQASMAGQLPIGLVLLVALYLWGLYRLIREGRRAGVTKLKTAITGGWLIITSVLMVALFLLISSAIVESRDMGYEMAKWFFYLYGLPSGIIAGMMILFRRYKSGGLFAIGAGFMAFLAAAASGLVVVTAGGIAGALLTISGGVLGLVSKDKMPNNTLKRCRRPYCKDFVPTDTAESSGGYCARCMKAKQNLGWLFNLQPLMRILSWLLFFIGGILIATGLTMIRPQQLNLWQPLPWLAFGLGLILMGLVLKRISSIDAYSEIIAFVSVKRSRSDPQ